MSRLSFKDFSRDQAIVKWQTFGSDDLIGFVAFAGDQNAVARLCLGECEFDGPVSVGFDMKIRVAMRKTGDDFFDDAPRFFGARVVAGDDGEVGARRCFAKQRSFVTITITAGSEDAEDSASGECRQAVDDSLQSVVGVSVVDEHGKGLSAVDSLKSARNEDQAFESSLHVGELRSQMERGGGGSQTVENVMATRQGDRNFYSVSCLNVAGCLNVVDEPGCRKAE